MGTVIQRNQADGPRVARCPWEPDVIGAHRLTISGAAWDSPWTQEVAMSAIASDWRGPHKGVWEEDCTDSAAAPVLWTAHASGGCWPFGVIVRNRTDHGFPARSIGLAHLAYNRDEEASDFGALLRNVVQADAADIYLTVMLLARFGTETEIRLVEKEAFLAFELGFGAQLASYQKILVLTSTVHAAVSRYGHFGELSNEDVAALRNSDTAQAHLTTRPCGTFVPIPRAEVRRRSNTL